MPAKTDTLMVHSVGANTLSNATRFSHNSVQGHHHSKLGVEYYADKAKLRWSMSVGCLLDPNSAAARYTKRSVLSRPVLGTGVLVGEDSSTLIISDTHFPYQHVDTFDFLASIRDAYECDRILHVGDLYDHHRGSYHESEGDSLDEETEYRMAKKYAHILQSIFPDMDITDGNHDAIPQRKLKSVGLPISMISDYNKLYDTADTWKWHDEYWFSSRGESPIIIPMRLTTRGRWDKRL